MTTIDRRPAGTRRSTNRDHLSPRADAIAATLRAKCTATVEQRFDPSMLAGLPEPARRWLGHAIDPGTLLARCADLQMHGEIRLGRHWHEFSATQVLVPDAGYLWAARTHFAHLPVNGFDSYADREGTMRWRMLGLPMRSMSGPDMTLSAAGRLAAESVLLPTSLVDASWTDGPDANSAVYQHRFFGAPAPSQVTVRVARDGALRSVTVNRWGNPDGNAYCEHVFEVTFDAELACDGLRIPNGIHAAWVEPSGAARNFFGAHLDTVTIR